MTTSNIAPMSDAPLRARMPFEYALLRVVPRIERGETVNAGVIVHCAAAGYLAVLVQLDRPRVLALDPSADLDAIEAALGAATGTAEGTDRAAGESTGRRFRWLTAPRSTVVQPGPVHTGLTLDPDTELSRLAAVLVSPVNP